MSDRWLIDWWLFWQFLLDYINTDHDFPCQIGTTLWKGKANDQENTGTEFEKNLNIRCHHQGALARM